MPIENTYSSSAIDPDFTRKMLDSAKLGIWNWHIPSDYLDFSDQWANMLGLDPTKLEHTLNTWEDLVHPDDLKPSLNHFQDYVDGKIERYNYQLRMRHADQSWLWIDCHATIVERDNNGDPVRVIGLHQDITESKERENKLREVNDRMDLVLKHTGIGLWEIDLSSNTIHLSTQCKKIATLDPSIKSCTLDQWLPIIHPDDRDMFQEAFQSHIDGHKNTFDIEYRLLGSDGITRWAHDMGVVVDRDKSGKPTRLAGFIRETTKRKQAEEEQRLSKERIDLVISGTYLGLWNWNIKSGKVIFAEQWAQLVGTPLDSIKQHISSWENRVHPDDMPRVQEKLKDHFDGSSKFYEHEYRVRTDDQTWVWILDRGIVVERDSHGNTIRMIGYHQDITHRKESERTLAQAKDLAEASNRAKSDFLTNMSHEIRTPLTAILGYTELIADPTLTSVERQRHLQTVNRNGQHLLAVINDVLDLSKIESGQMTFESIDTSPCQIAAQVATLFQQRAQANNISLDLVFDGPIPEHITSDPTRIRQVLMNLVGNAVKFTEQGSVTITVGHTRATTQSENSTDTSAPSAIWFDITDTGMGLTKDQATTLFQPFIQADTSVSRRFGGTGLGLTISRRIARLLDGSIELAQSTPNKGATFRFTIPTGSPCSPPIIQCPTQAQRQAAKNSQTPSSPTLLSGRILLAEDGIDNQRLISFHLQRAGASIKVANNGRQAVELYNKAQAESRPFDLIIMDIQMPEMDGHAATEALRSQGVTTPIIALTAHAMQQDKQRCFQAGCDAYQTKPIDKHLLLRACAHWINENKKRKSNPAA